MNCLNGDLIRVLTVLNPQSANATPNPSTVRHRILRIQHASLQYASRAWPVCPDLPEQVYADDAVGIENAGFTKS